MFKHIRQPEASETPQPWDFSGVLHLDLTWLKPKWNAWNNRTGFVSLWDPFQVWQSRECFHPAKAFQKQQDWLSDRIACYTIIYCFSSFQMNWAFYWVKKNHTVVTDSASYTGCAVTRRGTVAESTSLKLCSMSLPFTFLNHAPHSVDVNPSAHQLGVCSNRLLWTTGLHWFCCCKDMDI